MKKGEEFFVGIRVINSYNKQTGIVIAPRLVRLACTNGMVVDTVWTKSFVITHVSKLAENFANIIPEMIAEMVGHNDHFKALVEASIEDSVEWEVTQRIIQGLIKTEKHRDSILSILEELHQKNYTRWDIYNAVTNYCSHVGQLTPMVERLLQNKAQELLTSTLKELTPVLVIEGA